MLPVLFTLPPTLVRALVVLLALGALATAGLARRARFAQGTDRAARAVRWVASVAWLVAAVALGLFAYGAPWAQGNDARAVHALTGLFRASVWSGAWKPLPLYAYGALLCASFLLGFRLTVSFAERRGIPRARAVECYLVTAFAALAGSRLLYVLTNLAEFRDPQTGRWFVAPMFALRNGGLVAYGGFLFGALGSALYARRTGIALRGWADAAAPSVALGLGVTRVGCFLYGCDFGRVLEPAAPSFLRALGTFPRWENAVGSPAWRQHVEDGFRTTEALCYERFHGAFDAAAGVCRLDASSAHSAAVHPTQLYESLLGFGLFGLLLALRNRRSFPGQLALALGAIYGIARAGLEVLRDDAERGFFRGMSTSQWLGLVTGALCALAYARMWARSRPRPGDAAS